MTDHAGGSGPVDAEPAEARPIRLDPAATGSIGLEPGEEEPVDHGRAETQTIELDPAGAGSGLDTAGSGASQLGPAATGSVTIGTG